LSSPFLSSGLHFTLHSPPFHASHIIITCISFFLSGLLPLHLSLFASFFSSLPIGLFRLFPSHAVVPFRSAWSRFRVFNLLPLSAPWPPFKVTTRIINNDKNLEKSKIFPFWKLRDCKSKATLQLLPIDPPIHRRSQQDLLHDRPVLFVPLDERPRVDDLPDTVVLDRDVLVELSEGGSGGGVRAELEEEDAELGVGEVRGVEAADGGDDDALVSLGWGRERER
jgi:hypothetical protein